MQLTANDIRYILTEAQRRILAMEGVEWNKSYGRGGGKPGRQSAVNIHINQDPTDKGNMNGSLNTDTRVFGTKDAILNGDGTAHKNTFSLQQTVDNNKVKERFYRQVIDYCDGKIGLDDIDMTNVNTVTKNTFLGKLNAQVPLEKIKLSYLNILNRTNFDSAVRQMTYDRVNQTQNPDKVKRYSVGIIPDTNVKFIALFKMRDFNFSDAIKHGSVRSNQKIQKLMGSKKDANSIFPVTYDNTGRIPDIASNFSLKDVPAQHYKNQYALGDKENYTSVNQFIDKSVIYGVSALKDENFIPDYIVAPPSSSPFNKYYCTNLSRKLGCEYVDDFFQRKLIRVRVNGQDAEEAMRNAGFSEGEIWSFEEKVKLLAFKEVAQEIRTPIANYIEHMQFQKRIKDAAVHWPQFKGKSYEELVDMIIDDIFHGAVTYIEDNAIAQLLLSKGLASYQFNRVLEYTILNQKTKKPIENLMRKTSELLVKYADILVNKGGFQLKNNKAFKIVNFSMKERPFLKNVYIVADKNLSKNGELLTRYKNKKILIFDEDINSGTTLRLVINALQEKTMDASNKNVMCLVNGYSESGL